jgi:hypothetical protein
MKALCQDIVKERVRRIASKHLEELVGRPLPTAADGLSTRPRELPASALPLHFLPSPGKKAQNSGGGPMNIRTYLLASLLSCTAALPAFGQDRVRYPDRDPRGGRDPDRWLSRDDRDGRRDFEYESADGAVVGRFIQTGPDRWMEENNTGRWRFREVRRTPNFVELYDPNRRASVRLYADTSEQRSPDTDGWQPLYDGTWR